MKELSLREIKEVELEILKMFHFFCEDNNLRYFLGYGTLLGAIRYAKFIPWDDDIDLLMPREDYEKLLNLFQDNERYRLFSFEKNNKFHYPFAKVCDMTTRKEQTIYRNKGIELGIEIDIFPLDAFNDDFYKARKEAQKIQKKMKWLKVTKLDKPLTDNVIKRFAWRMVMIIVKQLGGAHFVKGIIKSSKKNNQSKSKYLGAKVWCLYGERGIIPAEVFSDSIGVEFEGNIYPAPIGYDTYLTCLYGDYLPEPPKEKQKTHHGFKAYKL